jgi:hypothetical protein
MAVMAHIVFAGVEHLFSGKESPGQSGFRFISKLPSVINFRVND